MSEPLRIGIPEVYTAVKSLEGQLNTFTQSTAVDVALLKRDVAVLQAEREAERARRWQLNVALIGAFVAIVMGALAIILE
jgi:hypothetical protein